MGILFAGKSTGKPMVLSAIDSKKEVTHGRKHRKIIYRNSAG